MRKPAVTLHRPELDRIGQIAKAAAAQHGWPGGRGESKIDRLRLGIMGEWALCCFVGIDPYREIQYHAGHDDGIDIAVGNRSVQVKTRKKRGCDFLLPVECYPLKAEVLVLAWRIVGPVVAVELAGWSTAARFEEHATQPGYLNGSEDYLFERRHFWPMASFLAGCGVEQNTKACELVAMQNIGAHGGVGKVY
jgi:hypothetical protein